jgi:hypothetical protein
MSLWKNRFPRLDRTAAARSFLKSPPLAAPGWTSAAPALFPCRRMGLKVDALKRLTSLWKPAPGDEEKQARGPLVSRPPFQRPAHMPRAHSPDHKPDDDKDLDDFRPQHPGNVHPHRRGPESLAESTMIINLGPGHKRLQPRPEETGVHLLEREFESGCPGPVLGFKQSGQVREKVRVGFVISTGFPEDVPEEAVPPKSLDDGPGLITQVSVELLVKPGSGTIRQKIGLGRDRGGPRA